jgi:hypothetical protein
VSTFDWDSADPPRIRALRVVGRHAKPELKLRGASFKRIIRPLRSSGQACHKEEASHAALYKC